MRLDPSLNITPEGSLVDLLTTVGNISGDKERKNQLPEEGLQRTSLETAYLETPETH